MPTSVMAGSMADIFTIMDGTKSASTFMYRLSRLPHGCANNRVSKGRHQNTSIDTGPGMEQSR